MKLFTKTNAIAAIIASTLLTAATANAGIADTKHNLGTSGAAGNNKLSTVTAQAGKTPDATEICVFCHTPHGANSGIDAPLWNKTFKPGTYETYADMNSTSIDGETLTVGSVSIACLSCHDGSQAMDVMSNESGSGEDTIASVVWEGGTQTSGKMNGFAAVAGDSATLKNDHPIGIQYAGGGYTATDPTASAGVEQKDADFHAPATANINGNQVWWVDTAGGATDKREKEDMVLYSRTGTTSGDIEPFVECASCHDPHQSETNTFLRIDNTGSAVCLACHDK
ncbi:cytochrome c3 family protein [Thalassotalea aquiviva]|uniref:cytochrome c3 family protein n=1 Tax=Thalassotalea aquiviva TaxID=3242415 RepID=UPI00352AA615